MDWSTHHTFGEASRHIWYASELRFRGTGSMVVYWDLIPNPSLFVLAAAQGGP